MSRRRPPVLALALLAILLASSALPVGDPAGSRRGELPSDAAISPAPAAVAGSTGTPVVAGPARPALPIPTWFNATAGVLYADRHYWGTTGPPGLTGASMATDPNSSIGYVDVLFGGSNATGVPQNATWLYLPDPSAGPGYWVRLTNSSASPPPLVNASMDFDEDIGEFVLFGGTLPNGADSGATWLLDPVQFQWLNYTSTACAGACPSPRAGAAMAYAANLYDEATVLFGGCASACATFLNDTWTFRESGGNWYWFKQSPSTAPTPRAGAELTGDFSATGGPSLLLFGGTGPGAAVSNETWRYEDRNWSNLSGGPGPPARVGGTMVYDWARSAVELSGGITPGSPGGWNTTWAWACAPTCTWGRSPSAGVPVAWGAGASDTYGGEPVVFGGVSLESLVASDATWVYQNATSLGFARSNGSAELGAPIAFNVSLDGGAGVAHAPVDRAYVGWTFAPPGGSASPVRWGNVSESFPTIGNWRIVGVGLDAYDVAMTVYWTENVDVPSVAIAAPLQSDVGVAVPFAAHPGGTYTGPLTFGWRFDGQGTNVSGPTVAHTFPLPGNHTVSLTLQDARGLEANATGSVTIVADPSVRIGPVAPPVLAGRSVTFRAEVSNGTAPFAYAWSFDGNPVPVNASSVVQAFAAPGSYSVNLTVTDAAGEVARAAPVEVEVVAALTGNATASPSTVAAGRAVNFSAAVSGGSSPYAYAWQFGDGGSSSAVAPQHVFATPGSYTVTLWINDSSGQSITSHVTVLVIPPEGSKPGPPGPPYLVLAAALAALAIVAAIGFAVLRWRGRRREPPPSI